MRKPLVNALTALALATAAVATFACSKADGHPRGSGAAIDSLSNKADLGRIDGSPDAKLWVVEVSDFQCPYCKQWHDESFAVIRDEFVRTGKIRFAFVNFPLPQHRNAQAAASSAMCAAAQGKFWAIHDSLFAQQRTWEALVNPASYFEGLATKAGVNVTTWKSCLTAKPVQSLIAADMDRARRAGVQSTPSFLVGGKLIEGMVPIDELRKAINDALAGR